MQITSLSTQFQVTPIPSIKTVLYYLIELILSCHPTIIKFGVLSFPPKHFRPLKYFVTNQATLVLASIKVYQQIRSTRVHPL